jgi:hypothetical protein
MMNMVDVPFIRYIEFLNLLKSPYEEDKVERRKNGGYEPILVTIHMYMEMSL